MTPTGARVEIDRGPGPVSPLPEAPEVLAELPVLGLDGAPKPLGQRLTETHTDAFVVVHSGRLVTQWYAPETSPDSRQALMSITKSFVGCIAGNLIAAGRLDAERRASDHVPQMLHGGYAAVTVRDLLDMRTGNLDFAEDYEQPNSEVHRLTQATSGAYDASTLHDLVAYTSWPGTHAGPFTYRSLDTEALGWVLEAVTGRALPDLLAELIAPLGFEHPGCIAVDAAGSAAASGGLALTARDLARFGLMIRHGGAVGDTQVVPTAFIKDTRVGAPDSVEAFHARVGRVFGPDAPTTATALYRNQFWVPAQGDSQLLCLGIHGQYLYIDGGNDTVVVKLSHWPTAQEPKLFCEGLECAIAAAEHLGGHDRSGISLHG